MNPEIEQNTQQPRHFRARAGILAALIAVTALHFAGMSAHRAALQSAEYPPPPAGMVLVPAGTFLYGTDNPNAGEDERPLRERFLPAFYIDIHEVTNA